MSNFTAVVHETFVQEYHFVDTAIEMKTFRISTRKHDMAFFERTLKESAKCDAPSDEPERIAEVSTVHACSGKFSLQLEPYLGIT